MSVGRKSFVRPLVALAIAAGLVLAAITALADRTSADRAATTQILTQLQPEAGADAARSVDRPLSEARNALKRADNATLAGDGTGARQLEGLARGWAELALDVARAEQATRDAGALQQAAADAAQRVQRARAMLDELAVRKARAAGELRQLTEQADAGVAAQSVRVPASAAMVPKLSKPVGAPKKGQAQ